MDGQALGLEDLAIAYERTAAAGLARARFEFDTGFDAAQWASIAQHLPGCARAAGRAAKPIMRRKVGDIDLGHDAEEGIVDLARRGSAMFPTHRPMFVVIENQAWYGQPGRALEQKDSFPAGTTHPLWLLALLAGVVDASPQEPTLVRGERCRVFTATADLSRASAATPGGLPTCDVSRVEDLFALPLTVALDDQGRVRRVAGDASFGSTGNSGYTVELWDFGCDEATGWGVMPSLQRPAA